MGFAIDPLTLVDAAIYPMILSYPMANSPSPLSRIHTSILERICPLSVPLSLQKASHIGGPVRPLVNPVSVPLVIPEISLKDASVPPFVDANSMPLIRLVVTLVRVAIGIVGFSVAVPLSVLPPSAVDATVCVSHGSERTGNRTVLDRVSQNPALVIALVSVRINNGKPQVDHVLLFVDFVVFDFVSNRIALVVHVPNGTEDSIHVSHCVTGILVAHRGLWHRKVPAVDARQARFPIGRKRLCRVEVLVRESLVNVHFELYMLMNRFSIVYVDV
mmetsp:Transcript_16155/g.40515  ORF Transcript_16155/g.40515 Transcript_16155/m.40515 type:complete len:274 (+) Transcript_16155:1366-2187(+)